MTFTKTMSFIIIRDIKIIQIHRNYKGLKSLVKVFYFIKFAISEKLKKSIYQEIMR